MKLPNAGNAVVEFAKLRDYCLSPKHLRGRHKARVFATKLGMTAEHTAILRRALLDAAQTSTNAIPGEQDRFGRRYVLDFELAGPEAKGWVRSAWIVRTGEDFPRLATCHVP